MCLLLWFGYPDTKSMYGAVLVSDQTQKHDSFEITIGREKVIIVRAGTYT